MSGGDAALIELGVIGAPFGVRGWVKLRSFTDPPEALLERRELRISLAGEWRSFRIEERGRSGGQLTAKLLGVSDRNAAQLLRGARIGVQRGELPSAAPGDYYRADLLGCEVVNLQGRRLGVVQHFVDTPAHALMVVREGPRPGGVEFWVPAVTQHLRRVDLAARRLWVDWDEAAD